MSERGEITTNTKEMQTILKYPLFPLTWKYPLEGHKSGLNWYQKIAIVSSIFSDHNALKLELNHKKKFGRNSNTWRLKSIYLKDKWINQEIREELKRFMEGILGWRSGFAPAFGPGCDPGVPGSSPASGSLHGACFSLCLCLCLSLSLSVSHE